MEVYIIIIVSQNRPKWVSGVPLQKILHYYFIMYTFYVIKLENFQFSGTLCFCKFILISYVNQIGIIIYNLTCLDNFLLTYAQKFIGHVSGKGTIFCDQIILFIYQQNKSTLHKPDSLVAPDSCTGNSFPKGRWKYSKTHIYSY